MAPCTRTLRTIQRMCLAVIGASLLASFLPLPMPALTSVFILSLVASVVGIAVALIDFSANARHVPRKPRSVDPACDVMLVFPSELHARVYSLERQVSAPPGPDAPSDDGASAEAAHSSPLRDGETPEEALSRILGGAPTNASPQTSSRASEGSSLRSADTNPEPEGQTPFPRGETSC